MPHLKKLLLDPVLFTGYKSGWLVPQRLPTCNRCLSTVYYQNKERRYKQAVWRREKRVRRAPTEQKTMGPAQKSRENKLKIRLGKLRGEIRKAWIHLKSNDLRRHWGHSSWDSERGKKGEDGDQINTLTCGYSVFYYSSHSLLCYSHGLHPVYSHMQLFKFHHKSAGRIWNRDGKIFSLLLSKLNQTSRCLYIAARVAFTPDWSREKRRTHTENMKTSTHTWNNTVCVCSSLSLTQRHVWVALLPMTQQQALFQLPFSQNTPVSLLCLHKKVQLRVNHSALSWHWSHRCLTVDISVMWVPQKLKRVLIKDDFKAHGIITVEWADEEQLEECCG